MDRTMAMTLLSHPAVLELVDQPGFMEEAAEGHAGNEPLSTRPLAFALLAPKNSPNFQIFFSPTNVILRGAGSLNRSITSGRRPTRWSTDLATLPGLLSSPQRLIDGKEQGTIMRHRVKNRRTLRTETPGNSSLLGGQPRLGRSGSRFGRFELLHRCRAGGIEPGGGRVSDRDGLAGLERCDRCRFHSDVAVATSEIQSISRSGRLMDRGEHWPRPIFPMM